MSLPAASYEPAPSAGDLFGRRAWLAWLLVILIFAVGLAVRLYRLADPPLDFHPTRQIHSALIARGMYYERQPGTPDWQREMAVQHWRMEGVIEPQVFERLAALTYPLTGGPDLRVPRLYALAFWLAAGIFITLLARDMAGWGGALLAALFWMAWPYGVTASRAFLPEPLMLALLAAAVWAARRWASAGGWAWALSAGLLAGLAIYIKPVALFVLAPALAVTVLCALGLRRAFRSRRVWGMALLALLPYAVSLVDGVYLRGYLVGQFSLRFFPQMWLDPAFYLRWVGNLSRAVPFEMTLAALLGTLLLRRPADRLLALAMWAGYVVYGFTLPHHISTHDYYHLLLYPQIALGLAGIAEAVFARLPRPLWLARAGVSLVLLAALVMLGYNARTAIKRSGNPERAQALVELGELLGPRATAVALTDDYAGGLKYYAWLTPASWLTAAEIRWREGLGQPFDFAAEFDQLAAGKSFFVITDLTEFEQQPELKDYLYSNYPVYRQSAAYLVFDLRSPPEGQ